MKGWYRESYRHSLAARGIDLKKYQGKYRQVYVKPVPWYQKGCKDVTAEYKLNKDGTMKVTNYCDDRKIEGTAKSISKDNRKLNVDFGFGRSGEYNIKKIDDDYNNVTVEGGDGTVWRLKRIRGEKRQAMAYVPTYGAADLPIMGVDAIGTAGAATVGLIPLVVGAGVVYGGARYGKKQYDKYSKKKKKKVNS